LAFNDNVLLPVVISVKISTPFGNEMEVKLMGMEAKIKQRECT
jgi:hypothetical protein